MPRPPPSPPSPAPPGARFRTQIEAAVAEGATPDDMRLRLTQRDRNQLARDPTIPLADIAYAKGEMRFLGVRVDCDGVQVSVLERGPAAV